ncbi:MAG: hypothetical protein IJ213_08105 [Bacteroidales bacterium]|nr:hypothetical protein [Bacteroidales bacterium]MBQ9312989.1 hypothetical protein [Bacteroidales bacterium]
MKKFCTLGVLLSLFCCSFAQTFIGTMKVDNYTRENVVAKLSTKGSVGTIELFDVKFSRFMPVTVDAVIPQIKVTKNGNKTLLTGNNIIPTVKNKGYEKYKVTNFSGTIVSNNINITTMMGNKKVIYSGKLKQ